ncbi:hypothetical protein Mapa_006819 [Marchantia paleacea]|nr:hypothetical protein Mapa_006819 [Marchantia paleacea]
MAGESQNGQEQAPRVDREPVAPPPVASEPEVGGVSAFIVTGNYGMMPPTGPISDEHLQIVTRQYAIKGVLFLIVGIVAILFPFIFGLAIEQLLAWLLLLGGGVMLIQFLMLCGSPGTTSFVLLGALHFCVGLWLLLKPREGLTALTFVLSGWFLAHGFLKVIMSWQVRHMRSWPAVLISGLLSIILGMMIVFLTPTYGLKLVGIIFGADLTATGVSVLVISFIAYLHRGRASADVESGSTREPLLHSDSSSRAAPAPAPAPAPSA